MTDILVSGYVHEFDEWTESSIPQEIIRIIFMFWLIDFCDVWDKKLVVDDVEINGQIVKITKKEKLQIFKSVPFALICGRKSVSKGSYSWRIRFKTEIDKMFIGVIEDDIELLEELKTKNPYTEKQGCWINNKFNCVLVEGKITKYHEYHTPFHKEGSEVMVTLNMDNHTLSYNIDGLDYGIATDKLDKDKYRFAVNLWNSDEIVELL